MVLKVLILLFACLTASAAVDCSNLVTGDPCSCGNDRVFIEINDTVTPGTTIANFNVSVQSSSCPYFNITDGKEVILLANLRENCSADVSCAIKCGEFVDKSIIVRITAVDQHPPTFPNSTFTTQIYEDEGVGGLVFDFSQPEHRPTDDDCPKVKSWSYLVTQDGGGNEFFGFPQQSSGELRLTKAVDFEQTEQYNLNVSVRTSVQGVPGQKGYTTVIVKIQDVDDSDPVFDHLEYRLNVTENTISTTPLVGYPPVRGYDRDKGINQTILYSFSGYQNSSDFLEINPVAGTFTVIKEIDRETDSSYRMLLWCFQSDNHEKTAFATLLVNVLDVNDNAAIFSPDVYEITMVENAVGYVTTVTATDKDIGDNAAIIYEVFNGTDTFMVNNKTGEVQIKSAANLDRETSPVLTFLVIAKDKDGNMSANTATVIVTLQDVNDNSPKFDVEMFVFHIDSASDGSFVGQVKAVDLDEVGSPNANVTYELYQTSTTVPFTIDELSGNLTVQGQYDPQTDYDFLVRACDNPVQDNDRRCSIIRVVVLYGQNGTFVTEDISVEVPENVPVGTVFGRALPVSGDEYVCSAEDFGVDLKSGMMITKTELDREENDTYNIHVDVFKYTEPVGNISLTISVLDMNDNAPTFTEDEYFFHISEQTGKNTRLGNLTAVDGDEGKNANLTFSFQNKLSKLFTIDGATGVIKTGEQWSSNIVNKQSLYHLIVVVADHGEPPLLSVASVYVSSMKAGPSSSVGIPTTLSKQTVMGDENKLMIERQLKDLLCFDAVSITTFDETDSHIFVKAFMNNSEVAERDLQRSLVQNWSPVQDLFRQYMEPIGELEHSDTDLSTAEIALITISAAVFFGGLISVIVICKQWDTHVKNNRLYDVLRRPSTLYDSQELRMNFSEDDIPSRFSTFRGPRKKEDENLEGSFGLGIVNSGFNQDGEEINAPMTPTWSCNDTPRVPRWSTTDSLKDAMESLEELTSRLNSEDNISRITNTSRGAKSQKSNISEPVTPRSEDNQTQSSQRVKASKGYEDLIIRQQISDYQKLKITPDYENLKLTQPTVETQVKEAENEDGYDSGISEADRIQEIIEANQDIADIENTDTAFSGVPDDIVMEESTAF